MKRRIISILAVCCLMVSMMPAAFATGGNDLQAQIDNTAAGGTVTLTGNVTISTPLTINKAITLDGNGNTLTYDQSGEAIKITTNDNVVIEDMILNAEASNGQGISLYSSSPKVEVNGVTMNVDARGISFKQDGYATNAHLALDNTKIYNSRITDGDYEHKTVIGDTRGISLFDVKSSVIDINNSEIYGFGYTINLAGTLVDGIRDYDGTTVNVTDSKLMGWTAFNVWSSDTTFNITNSYLKGINNSNGPTDGFATIVVNDDIYGYGWGSTKANMFYITGGTITNYRSGSASEQLFRVDDEGITEVNFEIYGRDQHVKIIDGTGDSSSVFYSGYLMTPDGWINYMTQRVHGEGACEVTGYNGQTLPFIPA